MKDRIEAVFSQLARTLYRNPIKILLSVLVLVGCLCSQIPKIEIDVSPEALLRPNDPTRLLYNDFREQFGRPELIVIAIESQNIFSEVFLSRLSSLHQDLEDNVPYLRKVTSLINARDVYGEQDTLVVGELMTGWPEEPLDMAALQKKVLEEPFYKNSLISEDGLVTTLIIETHGVIGSNVSEQDGFDPLQEDAFNGDTGSPASQSDTSYFSAKENAEVVRAVNRVVEQYDSEAFSIALAGDPIVISTYNRTMNKDILIIVALSMITVAIFLGILFRRVSGVILPEVVISSALFSTAGFFAIFQVPLKITTIVLPAFLLAVSVGDAVHVMAIFYRRLKEGSHAEDAIAYAMGHSGLAIVLTTLTTTAGLLSFSIAELTAIADIGLFGALGVILALIYTIVLLPVMVALIPLKKETGHGGEVNKSGLDHILLFFAGISMDHPKKIIVVCVLLFGLSIGFFFKVEYSHDVIKWLPRSEAVIGDVPFIDSRLRGSITLEAVVDTQKTNGVQEPELLETIEQVTTTVENMQNEFLYVGKVISINDIIKDIHQSLHENRKAYYRLPNDRSVVAQELLLFENSGSDDLERIVDSEYSKTRVSIKIPWVDAVYINRFMAELQDLFDHQFSDQAVIRFSGVTALMARSIPAALHSMASSYIIAFVLITLMMVIFAGSLKIGLLSMGANLLPIFMVMGIMGASGIHLDMSTIMIGSIAIGIVVDDTVHFLYNFNKYYQKTGIVADAVAETMLGTGRALLMTSIILSSGFFILLVSSLSLLKLFGILTGVTIVLALLADFLLVPALLRLAIKDHQP
jgi:predicted RND superfamily exporter protein